jgi:hypothetical protein
VSDTAEAGPSHRIPQPEDIRESLGMMLGRKVTVREVSRTPPEGAIPVAVGLYVDDTEAVAGCCWVDLPLGAMLGAAMSMVPQSTAEECLTSGVLPEEFQDNLHEVLNIASALLNDDASSHVRIRPLELLETGLAEDTLGLLADPRTAGYFSVDVADYGTGLLSFTLA